MALNMSLDTLFETSLMSDDPWWEYVLFGAGWTLTLTVCAFALALVMGTIVGTLRTTENKVVRGFCEAWIELFRNIPLIVQMFIWYYVVPELVPFYKQWVISHPPIYSQFLSAFICLGFFTSSRIAEQVRSGITSLPPGLPNAAKALGFTGVDRYRYVILPIAFRLVLPPLTSEAMNLIKNTAVSMTIGMPELTMRANEMGEDTFQFFAAYVWATALYVIISLTANRIMAWIESRSKIPGFIAS
ncbi:MAG: His/Glu/Gln/Arg/opine family amino ABC transporter, permease, 3-TM region [Burkholderia sp.]|jgi:glutamate/aspartate transport system permease protein